MIYPKRESREAVLSVIRATLKKVCVDIGCSTGEASPPCIRVGQRKFSTLRETLRRAAYLESTTKIVRGERNVGPIQRKAEEQVEQGLCNSSRVLRLSCQVLDL